jgi:hypothetical protein
MEPTKARVTDKVEDLAEKAIKPEQAEQVRGGRAGGDDDDLEELQVQRKAK